MREMWDARYAEPGFAYGAAPNPFIAGEWWRIPKGRVLCLAEGEGRHAVFLARQGYAVTAVDQSPVGLAKARAFAADAGVSIETIEADLRDFPLAAGAWEGIVSVFAHVAPDIRRRLHRDVVQGLVPGGALLLVAYTPAQLLLGTGGPPTTALMMSREVLESELDGLRFEILREVEMELHEGKHHVGRSAVVQAAARR